MNVKKIFKLRKSIAYKYFIICITICFGVIILLIPVYYTTLNTEYNNSVKELENKARENSERFEKSIKAVIQLNSTVNNLVYSQVKSLYDSEFTIEQYYKLIEVRKNLKLLSDNIEFVSLVYILFDKHNKIITNTSIYDTHESFFNNYLYNGYTSDSVLNVIKGITTPDVVKFLPHSSMLFKENNQKYVTLITRLHYQSASICAVYSFEDLMALYNMEHYGEYGFLCLRLPDNIIITSNDDFRDDRLMQFDDEIVYNSQTYRLIRNELSSINGSIILGISKEYFYNQMLPVKMLINRYYIIAIIVSFLLAVFFTMYIYRPIYKLISNDYKLDHSNANISLDNSGDEFRYIYDSIKQITFTNSRLSDTINLFKKMLHHSIFNNMLFGSIPVTVQKEIIDDMFPQFSQPFSLCIIDVGLDENIETAENISKAIFQTLVRYDMDPIIIKQGQLALIVEENHLQRTIDILYEINTLVTNSFGSQISAVFSRKCENVEDLHKAFLDIQLLEIASENIISFTPEPNSMTSDLRSIINVNEFIDYMMKGDSFAVEKVFRTTVKILIEKSGTYKDLCQLFYIFRSACTIVLFDPRYSDFDIEIPLLNDNLPVEEQFDALCEFSKKLTSFSEKLINSSSDFDQKIVKYIEENYCNPDMCIEFVASKFEISTKQVYRIVRKYSGKGFNEYVNRLRMDKAKKLLENSTSSIKDISEKCGFYSTNTFYKVFKRYNGISPSRYAKQIVEK